MAGRVPRGLQNDEAAHLVPLTEASIDRMARAGEAADERDDPAPGHPAEHDPGRLGRLGVALRAPERQAPSLADGPARPLVVGMGVRQGVGLDGPPRELPENPAAFEPRAGVDQHITGEISVDDIGRESGQLEQIVGERSHRGPL